MEIEYGPVVVKYIAETEDAQRKIAALEQKLSSMQQRRFTMDTKGLEQGLQRVSGWASGFGRLIDGVGVGMRKMGDAITRGGQVLATFAYRAMLVTAPITAMAMAAIKSGVDLETNMAMVATQLDLTGEELDKFIEDATKGAIDLSTEMPLAVDDIAKSLYYLVSSMTIDPALATKFLEPIGKLAVAGKMTMEETAKAITPIMNVYTDLGDSVEDVIHITDVFFGAVKRGRAEAIDFAQQLGDFIQLAERAGVTYEEAMMTYAEISRVTTPAQAATWLANFYRGILRPEGREALAELGIKTSEIVEGTGEWVTVTQGLTAAQQAQRKELEEQLSIQGIRLNEYVKKSSSNWADYTAGLQHAIDTGEVYEGINVSAISLWENYIDTQAKVNDMVAKGDKTYQHFTGETIMRGAMPIMEELLKYLGAIPDEAKRWEIIDKIWPTIRGMQGADVFLRKLMEIKDWTAITADTVGVADDAFKLMIDTVKSAGTTMWNTLKAFFMDIFVQNKDKIIAVFNSMTEFIGSLRDMPRESKDTMVAILGALVAVGPGSLIVATLMMGLGFFVQAMGMAMSPALWIAAGAFWAGFGPSIETLFGALTAYGTAPTDILQALVALAVQLGLVDAQTATSILTSLGISVQSFGDPQIVETAHAIREMVDTIQAGVDATKEWVDAMGQFIKDVGEGEGAIGRVFTMIKGLLALIGVKVPEAGVPGEEGGIKPQQVISGVATAWFASKIIPPIIKTLIGGIAGAKVGGGILGALSAWFGGGAAGVAAGAAAGGGGVAAGAAAAGTAAGLSFLGAVGLSALWVGVGILVGTSAADVWKRAMAGGPSFFAPPVTGIKPEDYIQYPMYEPRLLGVGPGPLQPQPGKAYWEQAPIDEFMMAIDLLPEKLGIVSSGIKENLNEPMQDALDTGIYLTEELNRKLTDVTDDPWLVDVAFNPEEYMKFEMDLDRLTEDRHITVWLHYKDFVPPPPPPPPPPPGPFHLGGYALHEGGYPRIELPNILPSEFVLSPYTTWLMERAMGRLDQGKMREVAEGGKGVEMRFYGPVTIDRSFASRVGLDDILRSAKV